ncbi:isochorismatase [Bacillus coahuilensis p1.1.43]|uniref:Isochorismatase n=1 Tax=Bacillus coahuilensis p1.1.43 TaxID=1150625 RepID=A0A147KBW3_9BACI|nr:cysteine hydrolase family protein [Bacillus coahuilensis]KUP08979.1 isochorismatase [Bacillus coahuilensis p1.1.43]
MKRALITIDYTVDFVEDNGALTCGKPAQVIERKISSITREFIENGDFTVFATDTHIEGDVHHPETTLFPPHNIDGTPGIELYGELKNVFWENKEKSNVYDMPKTRYSAFAGTDLDMKLRERGITDVYLTGVCSDICVLHTAIDAYNLGYKISVYKEAIASFNQPGHEWALGHFKDVLGATIL